MSKYQVTSENRSESILERAVSRESPYTGLYRFSPSFSSVPGMLTLPLVEPKLCIIYHVVTQAILEQQVVGFFATHVPNILGVDIDDQPRDFVIGASRYLPLSVAITLAISSHEAVTLRRRSLERLCAFE